MVYYAKSPTKSITEDKRDRIARQLKEILNLIGDDLEEWEINAVKGNIENLNINSEVRHKTLREHLDETVLCAEDFFKTYGDYFTEKEKLLIISACKYHDIGKANLVFQSIVQPQMSEVRYKYPKQQIPHGYLSTYILSYRQFCEENPQCTKEDYSVWLTSIYYHHDREDGFDGDKTEDYCNKYYLDCVREFLENPGLKLWLTNENKLLFSKKYEMLPVAENENIWCEYMLVKGMLNKFDWNVSAGYESAEFESDIKDRKLCRNIENKISNNLRAAQEFMRDNSDRNTVIVAPTGSGKTEAALLWLNGEKGFYTLPLKVSSNAIYDRIKHTYDFENAALLHSDSINGYIKETNGDIQNGFINYERAKLLSYPLTVCTVDQLFKFVYKALGTEIFAATLKYSKVIIDEIQSYDPRVAAALIYGLSELKIMGGKFAIITATFPPVLKYFMEQCGLIEEQDYIFRDFSKESSIQRHKVRIESGEIDTSEIISEAAGKKVLVICNTVGKAQDIYLKLTQQLNECKSETEVHLLHSKFIRKHRTALENEIMRFSGDENASGIWVTTQIVEASLDIDFDILFTEMCTADSLLQRMGRCNRAGRKNILQGGNIIVYEKASGIGSVYDKEIFSRSLSILKEYSGHIMSEADKTELINKVYDMEYIKGTDYFKKLNGYIRSLHTIDPLDYDMKKADKDFRKINSITVMPDAVYNENQKLIENIVGFLKVHGISRGVRKIFYEKLSSLTMDIGMFSAKNKYVPDNVDISTIENTQIHRTCLTYDFDEVTGKGRGLVMGEAEENNFII